MSFMVHLREGSDRPGCPVGQSSQIKLNCAIAKTGVGERAQSRFMRIPADLARK
jgi:hypothetical protein